MIFLYDNIYGKLTFPKFISELLDCPGLLRLKEIGMSNVKFVCFPSFSAVSRYEHALGVCHLANIAADSLSLSEKDKIELMIAALYHDITIPPFAHAMEEQLNSYGINFDHEKRFFELITGKTDDLLHSTTQIYQGRSLKLVKMLQSSRARKMGIDLYRIPVLATGDDKDPLSSLIKGDIDLDNIDNVIRAATAMGIHGGDKRLAENLAKSFMFHKENIAISQFADIDILRWKKLREILYEMILCSKDDFSLQTMVKHGLSKLIEQDNPEFRLSENDWKLTENEIFSRFHECPATRTIFKQIKLNNLYSPVIIFWLKGPDALSYINNSHTQKRLENIANEILKEKEIIINYYQDKRRRSIQRQIVHFGEVIDPEKIIELEPPVLVGLFSSSPLSNYQKNKIPEVISQIQCDLPVKYSLHSAIIITTGEYPKIKIGGILNG